MQYICTLYSLVDDFSRICLTTETATGSDYINASFVDVCYNCLYNAFEKNIYLYTLTIIPHCHGNYIYILGALSTI